MQKKETKEKKEEEFFSKDIRLILNELKKIEKKDFAKFSAIVAVVFSIGLWVVKSFWYAWISGRMLVYRVDNCYINTDSQNVLLEIIQLGAVLAFWIFINCVYYKISVAEDVSFWAWKRKFKKMVFWIGEMIVIFFGITIYLRYSVSDMIETMSASEWVSLIILLWSCAFLVNIFAFESSIEKKFDKRKEEKEEGEKKSKKTRIRDLCFTFAITVAVELVVVFFCGMGYENSRSSYKIVIAECDTESNSNVLYELNGSSYQIYLVACENDEKYILTRLYKRDGENKIDYDYQKVINKDGVETLYVKNVYGIGKD